MGMPLLQMEAGMAFSRPMLADLGHRGRLCLGGLLELDLRTLAHGSPHGSCSMPVHPSRYPDATGPFRLASWASHRRRPSSGHLQVPWLGASREHPRVSEGSAEERPGFYTCLLYSGRVRARVGLSHRTYDLCVLERRWMEARMSRSLSK